LAPRARHAVLWINGKFRGIYLLMKRVNHELIKRAYTHPEKMGNLYKGQYRDLDNKLTRVPKPV